MKFLKKYHKWLGVVLTIFILLFSVSGIVLNHRHFFSGIDVSRKFLPQSYHYNNWNNAAVKATHKLSNDSVLVYGNIGVWLTDSAFSKFNDFNAGFPKGVDNKKISKIYTTAKGNLFAGTLFGLYKYSFESKKWGEIKLPLHKKRIVDVTEKGDTLIVMSRSFILKSTDYINFKKITLPAPVIYDNKVSMFKTLWVIHSGEVYGVVGKLLVDLLGLVFIFVSITGLIYFVNRIRIKKRKGIGADNSALKRSMKWNIKWHNRIGWMTLVFLIVTTITGMFLRPPLLISIANTRVNKLPSTLLDSPNPWFDKLRRIIYDEFNDRFIIATLDGVYYSDENFKKKLISYPSQPPSSVMGVNVFRQISDSVLLVGSFKGLYLWDTKNGGVFDYINKKHYSEPKQRGSPIGNNIVAGFTTHFNNSEVYFDFDNGAINIDGKGEFVKMPIQIGHEPMSLWSVALEVHTARIFRSVVGVFYILIIPLSGLIILFILVSGFVVWFKKHRK